LINDPFYSYDYLLGVADIYPIWYNTKMIVTEPTIEHNSSPAYKLDNNILKIMKVLAVNELDDEAAEALTGMLVGDGLMFIGKNTKFKLERIE